MEAKINFLKSWLGTGTINIFGQAFSGKDTVGKHLAEILNAEFISSGDVMRATYANDQGQGFWEAAKIGSTQAQWMPQKEFIEMMTEYLARPELNHRPLILSMVGRWLGEEKPVMQALRDDGHETRAVILLNISHDEIWRRWDLAKSPDSRNLGRADDDERDKVARRLTEYRDKTLPVIEIYREMGLIVEINGEQTREAVFAETIDKLYNFAKS